jgi:hypothetical protein
MSSPDLHSHGPDNHLGHHHPTPPPAETPTGGGEPSPASGFLHDALSVARAANDLINGVADAAGLSPRVEEHPYGLVAAALGAGYVVGGGLFTATTARLLGMTARLAAIPAVRNHILGMAESALDTVFATPKPASPPTMEKTP